MKLIRPLAAGGRRLLQKVIDEFVQHGGVWAYLASDDPIDQATYDDPHKPRPRNPEVTKDLDGWEPLGKPFSR